MRLILIAFLLISVQLYSQEVTYNGLKYYKISESEVYVAQQRIFDTELEISSSIIIEEDTLTVVGIGSYAFSGSRLEKVILPPTIIAINPGAFHDCKKLSSINLPDALIHIEEKAFYKCKSLDTIIIPDNVDVIHMSAFQNCTGLKKLVIGNSTKSLGYEAFKGCTQLESVHLPESMRFIYKRAFENCQSIKEIKIPEAVEEINNLAFLYCKSLKEVVIPKNVALIGDNIFYGCDSLENIFVDVKNEHYASYKGALYNKDLTKILSCPGAKYHIDLPNSLTEISSWAFQECKNLKTIELPDSVSNLEGFSFSGCESMTSIHISKKITNLGYAVFSNCPKLDNITIADDNCCYVSIDGVVFNKDTTELIFCPPSKAKFTIPETVTKLQSNAFENCTKIDTIIIPESVNHLGNFVFRGCTNLNTIIILTKEPPYQGLCTFCNISRQARFHVPKKAISLYKNDNDLDWKNKSYIGI